MNVAKTAPGALRILWKGNVFLKPMSYRDVEAELRKSGYNFTDKNLMMALKSSRFLTRRGNPGDSSYIQKHPYVEDGKDRE